MSFLSTSTVTKRRHAARVTSVTHLVFAVALGVFMVTTQGSSAYENAGLAVTMAHVLEVALAVAAIVQLSLIAWWARLATVVRTRGSEAREPLDPRSRGNRATIIGCMAVIVAMSWLAESGYLAQARYETGTSGYGQLGDQFATVAMVLFAIFAGAAGITVLAVKLTERAGQRTAAVFAAASESADPGTRAAALRQARRIALRWAIGCGILMTAIAGFAGWALATGQFGGRVAVMAPLLFLINLARFRQMMRILRTIRHAQQSPI